MGRSAAGGTTTRTQTSVLGEFDSARPCFVRATVRIPVRAHVRVPARVPVRVPVRACVRMSVRAYVRMLVRMPACAHVRRLGRSQCTR
jgi:hypothetical protein